MAVLATRLQCFFNISNIFSGERILTTYDISLVPNFFEWLADNVADVFFDILSEKISLMFMTILGIIFCSGLLLFDSKCLERQQCILYIIMFIWSLDENKIYRNIVHNYPMK